MLLFLDTETSHLYNFKAPPHDPSQPHICQLAALVTEDDGTEVTRINTLIRPVDWMIAADATAIHGFTTEQCFQEGLPILSVLSELWFATRECHTVIGHNIDFDANMVLSESLRCGKKNPLYGMKFFCTMRSTTNICKLPHKNGRSGFKWPKLAEAFEHFIGKPLEGAHDAMTDVLGCKDVYFAMQNLLLTSKE